MELQISHADIKKTIIKSQHCQRNWDLSKEIPDNDLETILYSVTNCPSKQNHAFYKVHAITNRTIIESIHANTNGFGLPDGNFTTNSQTLANLLLVFEEAETSQQHKEKNKLYENGIKTKTRDITMAVGIAAGYANLISSILGYATGYCACFDSEKIKKILNMDSMPVLIMGIGFEDKSQNRRIHHKTGELFPSKSKEHIEVNIVR